jgi:hypothetical protein
MPAEKRSMLRKYNILNRESGDVLTGLVGE